MQQQRDENLMLVAAVEQYAQKYGIPTIKSLALFRQYNIEALKMTKEKLKYNKFRYV
jgi:hypothetical protein